MGNDERKFIVDGGDGNIFLPIIHNFIPFCLSSASYKLQNFIYSAHILEKIIEIFFLPEKHLNLQFFSKNSNTGTAL
jgi:hypothetical protein